MIDKLTVKTLTFDGDGVTVEFAGNALREAEWQAVHRWSIHVPGYAGKRLKLGQLVTVDFKP